MLLTLQMAPELFIVSAVGKNGSGGGGGGVEFDYSAHTMAGRLMIPLHLGTGVCRLQALAAGDTGLAKC